MSTRLQIREQSRVLLKETDSSNSNFTDGQLNEFANQGVRYLGVLTEYPRDYVQIPGDSTAETYTVPEDFLFMRSAFFGDTTVKGEVAPLKIIQDKTLTAQSPGWLENTTDARGKPTTLIMVDRNSFMVYPKISQEFNGKPIIFNYCYVPRPMAVDTDEPELPLALHDAIQFYVVHLCYINLQMADKAAEYLGKFDKFRKSVESASTKETEEGHNFEVQYQEDV